MIVCYYFILLLTTAKIFFKTAMFEVMYVTYIEYVRSTELFELSTQLLSFFPLIGIMIGCDSLWRRWVRTIFNSLSAQANFICSTINTIWLLNERSIRRQSRSSQANHVRMAATLIRIAHKHTHTHTNSRAKSMERKRKTQSFSDTWNGNVYHYRYICMVVIFFGKCNSNQCDRAYLQYRQQRTRSEKQLCEQKWMSSCRNMCWMLMAFGDFFCVSVYSMKIAQSTFVAANVVDLLMLFRINPSFSFIHNHTHTYTQAHYSVQKYTHHIHLVTHKFSLLFGR